MGAVGATSTAELFDILQFNTENASLLWFYYLQGVTLA